jgi:hypothetical protein
MHDYIVNIALLATLLSAGCDPAGDHRPPPPGMGKADDASTVLLGGTSYCPDAAPYDAFDNVTYTRSLGKYQALSFRASEGDQPEIILAADGARPRVWLEDETGNLMDCNHNDDGGSVVDLDTPSLERGGLYFVIFDNQLDEDASFRLRVDCSQGDCASTHACGVAVPLSQ